MLSQNTPPVQGAIGPPVLFIGLDKYDQEPFDNDEIRYFAMVPVKMQPQRQPQLQREQPSVFNQK